MTRQIAAYRCLACGCEWTQPAGPTQCPYCGHLYVRWLNFDVRSGSQRILLMVLLLLTGPALAGELPNPQLTPGVVRALSREKVCATQWGKDARAVTSAMKRSVMAAYRMTPKDCPSGKIEIDHLISRELGGADDVENLWPQCYEKRVAGVKATATKEWGAHKKDQLENALHREVCAGSLTLAEAQKEIAGNWIAAYRRRFD